MGMRKHCFPQCLGKLEGHSNQEFYFSLLTIPLISKTQNRNSLQSFPWDSKLDPRADAPVV